MESELITDKSPNYRVVLIGNSAVGKTSILQRLIYNVFKPANTQTVGAAFFMHTVDIDGKKLNLQIWDTAGQERYKAIGPIYYRNSGAAVVVYDQTEKESFENLPSWIDCYKDAALPDSRIYVVGNKKDKIDEISVPENSAKEFCKENDYRFYSVSALTGDGIPEIFTDIAKDFIIHDQMKKMQVVDNAPKEAEKEKKKCC